jgi:GTPase SAR1 family protein
MPRVFISHATPDRPLLEELVIGPLHSHGVATWFCKDDILGSNHWEPAIRKGLQESDWFLLAMTPNAQQSEWVKAELEFAFHIADNEPRRREWVIPIILGPCKAFDFHLRLANIQFFDFHNAPEKALPRLLKLLGIAGQVPTDTVLPAAPVVSGDRQSISKLKWDYHYLEKPAEPIVSEDRTPGLIPAHSPAARLADILRRAEAKLTELGVPEGPGLAERLLRRVESPQFRVLLLGAANRGKTTLLNALLGRELLPTWPAPTTGAFVEAVAGSTEEVRVVLRSPLTAAQIDRLTGTARQHLSTNSGEMRHVKLAELNDYICREDSSADPDDFPYELVEIATKQTSWPSGLTFVDPPEITQSVLDRLTADYLPEVDLVLFLVDAQGFESPATWRLLDDDVHRAGHEFIVFVCNRGDTVRQRDWPRLRQQLDGQLPRRTRFGSAGVFFLSAQKCLEARLRGQPDPGDNLGMAPLEKAIYHLAAEPTPLKLWTTARHLQLILDSVVANVLPARRSAGGRSARQAELATADADLRSLHGELNVLRLALPAPALS